MTKTRDLADLGGGFIQAGTGAVQRTVESKLQDVVSVKDFGAVGDGVTDDAPAFQLALNTGFSVLVPYSASGYKINSTLILNAGYSIQGAGAETLLVAGTGINNGWFFEVRGSNTTVDSLKLSANSLANGAGAVRIRTDLAGIENVKIHNVETAGCNYAVKDEAHASNILTALQLRECRFRLHRGPGVAFVRAFAYITLTDVVVDYVGSASKNHVVYSFTDNEGMFITNVDTTGGTVDGTTTNQDGFVFNSCIAVWMVNCMADTVGGHGFTFKGGTQFCYVNNCVSSLNGKYGFNVIESSSGIVFTQCVATGRNGLGYAPATQHGFFFKSSDSIQVTGCKTRYVTGAGFFLDGAANAMLTGCRAEVCTGYGIDSTGSNVLGATAMALTSCAAGNFNFSSGLMYAFNAIYNSGGTLALFSGPGAN